MRKTLYRYNKKTLRYERVGFSIWRFGLTLSAYVIFGFLFFQGLNFVQNFFIETEGEKSLKAENNSLHKYKSVLKAELENSNQLLELLKIDENKLYEKLFEAPIERESSVTEATASKVAESEDWNESIRLLNERVKAVDTKAKMKSYYYSQLLGLDKRDVPTLIDFPSIAPVKDLNDQNLVSGFGVRINPFHKGNYHHDGIDIALPKGTEVLATGNGRIINISRSTLEAGLGNYIEIDHGNGIVTRYSHLEEIRVTWGQQVKQGQVIALSGSSGSSVAPHLHYDVIKNGKNLDPLTYILEDISAESHQRLAMKSKSPNQSLD